MCYNAAQAERKIKVAIRHGKIKPEEVYNPLPFYSVSAFLFPDLPVISSENVNQFQFYKWGLIPSFTNTVDDAKNIREYTLNAKSETIFEKASYKNAIREKRCLVILTGFFEWMELNGKKYPHYIYLPEQEQFAVGAIWDEWCNKNTGELVKSFSIVTTEANSLMEKIHNTKKRMPLIFDEAERELWLQPNLSENDIKALMQPYASEKMQAHTVSKRITDKSKNPNTPEVQEPFVYQELNSEQQSLF